MPIAITCITVRLTCPLCDTTERMEMFGPIKVWQGGSDRGSWRPSTDAISGGLVASAVASCPECKSPFGVFVTPGGTSSVAGLFQAKSNESVDSSLYGGTIATIPQNPVYSVSLRGIPTKIREAFQYIEEDSRKRRNPVGILSGARACLDVALKELGENSGGRRERISKLAQRGIITLGIAEWSQKLWEEGSDAVHDLDANIDRAIEHVDFLKLFFEVAFDLPSKITEASHGLVEVSS